jgi:hypothetical protein
VPSSEKIKSVLKSNKSQKIKSELSGGVVFVDEIEQGRGLDFNNLRTCKCITKE